jgi:Uncharacterized protein conserved in bacteria
LEQNLGIERKGRDMNVELLRILLMLMIVTLHYLSQGGFLSAAPAGSRGAVSIWTLEIFSFVGVNGFVMISGYYLAQSEFKLRKLITLIVQIVFTSSVIYLIFAAFGLAPLTRHDVFGAFFPILTGKYWFVTSYVAMYCLVPFLNMVIKSASKRQMQGLIALLSLMFCTWRAFFPPLTMMNTDGGYNVVWLVCLYFFAAYLRLYWDYKINKYIYLAVYILCCAFVTWRKCMGDGNFLSYVSVPITAAAVALFLFFREVRIRNTVLKKVIGFFSPLTFGVYLISENIWFRKELYTSILHTKQFVNTPSMAYMIPVSILAVFLGCALLDYLRSLLFKPLLNSMQYKQFCEKLSNKLAA